MANTEEQVLVKFKYALALKRLQEKNKKLKKQNDKKGIQDIKLDISYGDISSSTGLRVATISDIFNGNSEIKAYTLYLILNSLGFSFKQFGDAFDKLTHEEVLRYRIEIESQRQERNQAEKA